MYMYAKLDAEVCHVRYRGMSC